MLSSIIQLINEFVIKPVLIEIAFVLPIILYFFRKKPLYIVLPPLILGFILIFFTTLAIKTGENRWISLGYIFILAINNIFFSKLSLKRGYLYSFLVIVTIFFTEMYIVERILFE
jgi:hypothetical protein